MPGRKNPTPADESAARRAKLAELERAREQLLEEEREAAARHKREAAAWHEREAAERQRWEAVERREREIMETRDRHPHSEAGGSQARQWSALPGVSQSGGPAQSSRCINLQFRIQERGGIGKH